MHGVENQDSKGKMGVIGQCGNFCVRLLGMVISVCMYGCFVTGVCTYGLAVVEDLWRPTRFY